MPDLEPTSLVQEDRQGTLSHGVVVDTEIAVIGARPAGLTAAYQLSKRGWDVTVIEADPIYVGGISRTVRYRGFLFDIGGPLILTTKTGD